MPEIRHRQVHSHTNEPDSDDDQKDNKADNIPATSTSKARVTMVRLAHFSVKEYLVSDRIRMYRLGGFLQY